MKEPKAAVTNDFSVSLISTSLFEENKFNKDGNNKNVTSKETINPKVIIQQINNWFYSTKTKDRKAHIVVKTV